MDDWFQEFKGCTYIAAQVIFKIKLLSYSKAIHDCQDGKVSTIKGAALTNDDIPYIINDCQDDPIDQQALFTVQHLQSWLNVGFIPFTCKALSHWKVRQIWVMVVQVMRWLQK